MFTTMAAASAVPNDYDQTLTLQQEEDEDQEDEEQSLTKGRRKQDAQQALYITSKDCLQQWRLLRPHQMTMTKP